MKRILLLGGTSESRWISRMLLDNGREVIASVTTEPARKLFPDDVQEILVGKFTPETLWAFLEKRRIHVVVDATHPFAEIVSKQAIQACDQAGIIYIRYERPSLADSPLSKTFVWVADIASAATSSCREKGNVLVATGAKRMAPFLSPGLRDRAFFRLLKTELADSRVEEYGLNAKQIWWDEADPKPESVAQFLKEHKIQAAVVKDSGPQGISLALAQLCPKLGMRLFVLRRPEIPYPAICSGPEELEKALHGEYLRHAAR